VAALLAARPGAVLVAVGIQEGARPARLADWTLREYDFLGTVAHVCATDLPAALDLLAASPADWSTVAPDVLPLGDLVTGGLEPLGAGRPVRVKTLFDPSATQPRPARHRRTDG
jgi:threonine dehydrogenase-like Zn-dependent dehydrogenase